MHPKRHPFVMDYAVGCDREGKLTAMVVTMHSDSGAYAERGLRRSRPRRFPFGRRLHRAQRACEGHRGHHQQCPCGAMRGFGVNQSNFALSSCLGRTGRDGRLLLLAVPLGQCPGGWQDHRHGSGLGIRGGVWKRLEALKERFQQAKYAAWPQA